MAERLFTGQRDRPLKSISIDQDINLIEGAIGISYRMLVWRIPQICIKTSWSRSLESTGDTTLMVYTGRLRSKGAPVQAGDISKGRDRK